MEIFEFSADNILKRNMQKDRIVQSISKVELNPSGENIPVKINNIEKTEMYLEDGCVIAIENGYLDIGLIDTMKDLIVNLLGAIAFSIIGFLYIQNREKYKFAQGFIPIKK